MPTRELLAPSQRAQFTDFTAPLDDRTLARFYTLSDTDLERRLGPERRLATRYAVGIGGVDAVATENELLAIGEA